MAPAASTSGWNTWLKKFMFFYLVGLGLTLSFRLFSPTPPGLTQGGGGQRSENILDLKQGSKALQQSITKVGAESLARRAIQREAAIKEEQAERAGNGARKTEEDVDEKRTDPPDVNPASGTLEERLEPLEDGFEGYYTVYPPSIFGPEDEDTATKNRIAHHNTGGKHLLYNTSCFPQRPLLPDNKTLNPHHCGIMVNAVLEAPLDTVSQGLLNEVKNVVLGEVGRYDILDYVRAIPVVVVSHLLFGDSDASGAAPAEDANTTYGGVRTDLGSYWEETYTKYPGPMPRPKDTSDLPGVDFAPVVEGFEVKVQRRYTLSSLPSYVHFYQLAPAVTTHKRHPEGSNFNVKKMAAQVAAQPYSLMPLSPFRRTLFANMSVRIGVPVTTNAMDKMRNKMTPPTLVALPLLDHYDMLFIPAAHHDLLLRPLAEYEEDMLRFLGSKAADGTAEAAAGGDPVAEFLQFVHKGKKNAADDGGGSRLPLLETSTMLEPTFTTTILFYRNPWDPMGGQREGSLMNIFLGMWKALHIRYLTMENGFLPPGHSSVANSLRNEPPTPAPIHIKKRMRVAAMGQDGGAEGEAGGGNEGAAGGGEGGATETAGGATKAPYDFQEEDLQKLLFSESSTYCARDTSFGAALRESGARYTVVSETICQDHRFTLPDTCGLIRGRWKDRYLTARCDGHAMRLGG